MKSIALTFLCILLLSSAIASMDGLVGNKNILVISSDMSIETKASNYFEGLKSILNYNNRKWLNFNVCQL